MVIVGVNNGLILELKKTGIVTSYNEVSFTKMLSY